MTLEKVQYTAKIHTTGGRAGASQSDDGRLVIRLSTPGSSSAGTNPEQLFAAGWSACFIGAMQLAAARKKITLRLIRLLTLKWTWAQPAAITSSEPGSTSVCPVWSTKLFSP